MGAGRGARAGQRPRLPRRGAPGKITPYGIYDLTANTGWVNVGTDHDTGAFAVASIHSWCNGPGRAAYPRARRLLVTADSSGSNGARLPLWKTELAALAAEAGLDITVLHLPPGSSKRNRIEHRLLSAITMNFLGRPLVSHEVIIEIIRHGHHQNRPEDHSPSWTPESSPRASGSRTRP